MSATSIHLAGFSEMTLQVYEIYRTIADSANFFGCSDAIQKSRENAG